MSLILSAKKESLELTAYTFSPVCIDVKLHPTDLNLLLVAYEGGVSLWNIAEKRAELNWECECRVGSATGLALTPFSLLSHHPSRSAWRRQR